MKVLQIIPSMHPDSGGTSQGIRNMIPELEKLGIYNEVLTLDDPAEDFHSKDPFLITALGPAKGPWRYSSKLVPWLVNNLSRFDVVIVNALWLYHGYAFEKAFAQFSRQAEKNKEANVKIPRFYIMPHGMLDPYFQKAPERRVKAMRNWIYWKLIEHKLVNKANGLLFTCKEELVLARQAFRPYHPKQEFNIGYGTEAPPAFDTSMSEAFFEKCPALKNQSFILFLSRIHEKKGLDLLLRAYEVLLNKKIGNGQLDKWSASMPKLVIAGPGLETDYGKKMLQMVAGSGKLEQSVFFPGMLSGKAKWGAFYASEAFILPSHQENFGIAVVEALACGKPVLISNQVNIWREIMEGEAGIVEDDTLVGTSQLLDKWIRLSPGEKGMMGRHAQNVFVQNFTIRNAAKKFSQYLTERETA